MVSTPTILIYMTDMYRFEDQAEVIDVVKGEDERLALVLNQTIFYPQGGGQPYDCGIIKSDNADFEVQEVRFKDGIVYHIGSFKSGSFENGETVTLLVDEKRRHENNKNHTAGHVIDIAMSNLGMKLMPARGYHFPDGAYVEYLGTSDEQERATLLTKLQQEVDKIISAALSVSVKMVSIDELRKMAQFVPDYIPKDKPSRVMIIQGFYAIPCGGTHVPNTKDIGVLKIEKIKNKKGNMRISYSI